MNHTKGQEISPTRQPLPDIKWYWPTRPCYKQGLDRSHAQRLLENKFRAKRH